MYTNSFFILFFYTEIEFINFRLFSPISFVLRSRLMFWKDYFGRKVIMEVKFYVFH